MIYSHTKHLPVNVLLVDDKKENLYVLEELLEDKDIRFLKTTSGYEALKIALNNDIALILLDVQMPEINGYEVARLLKQNSKTKNIPIIFVTALSHEQEHVLEGYETGAVDFLFKPLNPFITKAKSKAFIQIYLQQKDLEEKNASLENLGLLVNNSIDLMCILDGKNLSISTTNKAWEKVLQYSEADIVGSSFEDYVFNHGIDIKESLGRAISTNDKIMVHEMQMVCKNGDIRWFSWIFVFKNGNWYANGRDITKRREAEEALSKINEELEQRVQERTSQLKSINDFLENEIKLRQQAEDSLRKSNEQLIKTNADLDNFVYTASHDLKLPIANMEGLIRNLTEELKGVHNADIDMLIDMLGRSTNQLSNTVGDLLQIIRLQKEKNLEVEEVDCLSIFEEIIESIKDLVNESKASISHDFRDCFKLRFPKANLKSIFYNLLTNAIKYRSPERPPQIFIKLVAINNEFMLSVKDNGLGIKKESQGKLFSMFKRFHSHVEGSGIGLYIVKETIERYGGRVEVVSEEGVGSEFKIFFKAQ
jgi:PAS domain S-box-containing protein